MLSVFSRVISSGLVLLLLTVLGSRPALAWAGEALSAERILRSASEADDLTFPSKPSKLSFFSGPEMAIYKPEGKGPFPAIVLVHTCGGLTTPNQLSLSMLQWAKDAVARGYVAFLVDTMGPRGVDNLCFGPKKGVNFFRGAKDAFQAVSHLEKFDFVDKKKIGLAGYSWGAMVGILASSKVFSENLSTGEGFKAVVSFYPGCFRLTPKNGTPYEVVQPEIKTPLLALLGGKDTETPAADCVEKLGVAKAAGAPVEWHLYPEATHCWDCKDKNGLSKTDVRGNHVVYRYDEAITVDSGKKMFEFFDKHLK